MTSFFQIFYLAFTQSFRTSFVALIYQPDKSCTVDLVALETLHSKCTDNNSFKN